MPHLNSSVFSDLENAASGQLQSKQVYLGGHRQLVRRASEGAQLAGTVE